MASGLQKSDVERLLSDRSANSRAETAAKLAAEFAAGTLTPAESDIAHQIFATLVKDAAVKVRDALSAELSRCRELPHDIALALARDLESVALPVLEFSQALTDQDLIALVASRGAAQQMAIARRASVSAPLADALVDTRNQDVVMTLVANDGAELTETSMNRALDMFVDASGVADAMARRASLPIVLAERMLAMVSDQMYHHLVSRHDLPSDFASDAIMRSRERATLALPTPGSSTDDVAALVRQLHANGRLTDSIILRALSLGDMRFFEAALSELSGIPLINAWALIHDEGRLGLGAILQRSSLPSALYPAFRAAVDVARETEYDGGDHDRERFKRRMLERILTKFDDPASNIGAEDVDYLLAKLNQVDAAIELAR